MATETHHTLLAKGYTDKGFGSCSSCHAGIIWYTTDKGKWIPYDRPRTDQPWQDRPLMPHWATCPNANQHRKPKPSTQPQPSLFAEVR